MSEQIMWASLWQQYAYDLEALGFGTYPPDVMAEPEVQDGP